MEGIPMELIINWDQTGMKYVLVSNWTFETKGAKRVEIAGLDDKWQITVLPFMYYGWKVAVYASDLCWQDPCLLT